MGNHGSDCKPTCNDSHDSGDPASGDYLAGQYLTGDEPQKSGCFVATAVYGGAETPQVMRLRHWGETSLRVNPIGKYAVAFYEFVSPPIANWLKTQPRASALVRSLLDQVVKRIPELPQ